MPQIKLEIVRDPVAPPPWTAPPGAGPLFTGTGDNDYICGCCDFVIAANIGSAQRLPEMETQCPCCGAVNRVGTD